MTIDDDSHPSEDDKPASDDRDTIRGLIGNKSQPVGQGDVIPDGGINAEKDRAGGSPTNTDEVPDFNPDWAFPFYHYFAEKCLSSEKRQVIVETLCEVEYGALSTQGLAEVIEEQLKSEGLIGNHQRYDAGNLNQVLSDFESVGLVYRAPKFEQDDEYVTIPMDRMLGWLGDSELKKYLDPERQPNSWGTHYYGRYIESRLSDQIDAQDDLGAGNPLPAKALFSAAVSEYGSAEMDIPSVDLAIGSLSRIRDSEFDLNMVVPHLSVENVIPTLDGPYVGDKGVHDYAIFVHVTNITEVKPGLHRRLNQILSQLLASVQTVYERIYEPDADPLLSDIELGEAITNIENHEQMSKHAIERFDLDSTTLPPGAQGDDDSYTVVAGLYRRSGKDEPQKELS